MKAFVAVLVAFTTACASVDTPSVRSVREVRDNQHKLDGEIVFVRGWIVICRTMWCRITESPGKAGALPEGPYQLSIGADERFQESTRFLLPAEVVLKARVDASCRQKPGDEAIPVCADGIDLRPIEIVRVITQIDKHFK